MMLKDPQNKLVYDSEEGILSFDTTEFFKVFIYHALYHFTIGPFVFLIIAPMESWNFARNLKIVDPHIGCITQFFPWIVHAYVMYVIVTSEERIISEVIIPVSVLWYFLRFSIIATRYATAIPSQSKRYRNEYVKEMDLEFLVNGWLLASPKQFEEKIRISMGRNQIENVLFTFRSLKKLNQAQFKMYRDFEYFDK